MSGSSERAAAGEDCRCYAASSSACACPAPRNITHPLRYYEFTPDEIRALEECDSESFYRRCLPFGAALGGATLAAVKSGYLRRNPHFGAVPKVALALLAGHAAGRLSHQPACAARLRRLPADSHLGSTMRHYHARAIASMDPHNSDKHC